MEDIDISAEEYLTIIKISGDISFIQSMIKLKESDPIEFQLKLSQFKNTTEQNKVNNTDTSNQRKCKYCGSTSFTPVRRKWSPLMGFLTNKTDLICNNCGRKTIDR